LARVQIVVQHHPSRADLLPRLTARLTDPLIVTDPGGSVSSAWRTYRLCLRAAPADATHVLIVQDDAEVCDHFEEAVTAAIEACEDACISFCTTPQCRRTMAAMTQAMKKREPWAAWDRADFWPVVCSSYPVAVARAAADWVDRHKPDTRNDDAPMGEFLRASGACAVATVPSLAQHPDDVPSLVGRKFMSGTNPARLAKWLVQGDPRTINW
jgi:hypothetical protein